MVGGNTNYLRLMTSRWEILLTLTNRTDLVTVNICNPSTNRINLYKNSLADVQITVQQIKPRGSDPNALTVLDNP